ncbi:oligosaccharide flippase family protein [Chryseomicrobium aureum]|uniref:oligosaccharide flippase family protein n=1 Tax=Chryseomicrobium aureum TaxID=1441723 RepID=UPI001EF7BC6E|nr:oligosaccharide flippase family protein [Chryseomicrobium aureum]
MFKNRLLRNSFFNLLAMTINIVSFIIITPYIVNYLGVIGYGIYITLIAITGFMSTVDLGLSGASTRQFSHFYSKGEFNKFNISYTTSLFIYLVLGILLNFIIFIFNKMNLIYYLFDDGDVNQYSLEYVLYLGGLIILLNMILIVSSNISIALQKNSFNALGKIFITITEVSVIAFVIYHDYSIVGLMYAKISSLLIGILSYYLINKKITNYLKLLFLFDSNIFRDLISFGVYNLITQISNALIGQADKIIINLMLGPQFVTYYSIPMSIAQRIHSLVATAANVIFPATAELNSTSSKSEIRSLYLKTQNIVFLFSAVLIFPFIFFSKEILELWIDVEFAENAYFIFLLILISYLFIGSNVTVYFMFNGLNMPKYNAYYAIITAAIKIISTIVLIYFFDLIGAGISLLLTIILIPFYIRYFEKMINVKTHHYLLNGYIPVIFVFIITFSMSLLIKSNLNIWGIGLMSFLLVFLGIVALYKLDFFKKNNINIFPSA